MDTLFIEVIESDLLTKPKLMCNPSRVLASNVVQFITHEIQISPKILSSFFLGLSRP